MQTPFASRVIYAFNRIDAAAIDRFEEDIRGSELDLVGCILSGHKTGVPVAHAAGVMAGDMTDDACRLIFAAATVLLDAPLIDVLKLARIALHRNGLWTDDDRRRRFGPSWCNWSLNCLAAGWPGPEMVPVIAARVRHLRAQKDTAVMYINRAIEVIRGDVVTTPELRITSAPVQFRPSRRYRKCI